MKRQIAGRLKALLGDLFQAMADDAVEARVGQRGRIFFQDGGHGVGRGFAPERPPARQHLVEDGAKAEDVRAIVGWASAHLLGGHVAHRPQHHAGLGRGYHGRGIAGSVTGALGLDQLSQAEVEDLDPAVVGDEQVLGLQVAVYDPLLVGRGQTARHAGGVFDCLALGQRRAGHAITQRFAFEQLGDDVGGSIVSADIVDDEDIGMVQRPGRLDFLLEAA
jgi:hypothetical protein